MAAKFKAFYQELSMQPRMEKYRLESAEIRDLLVKCHDGVLSTMGSDGPYAVPINFVYLNDKIYFHGRAAGQKLDNIKFDPRVCFTVYEVIGFRRGSTPCETATFYKSVVVRGHAKVIAGKKAVEVLEFFGRKYSPDLFSFHIPENKAAITQVVEIEITDITGKYCDK
jgi:nitroimidazol reductase NimA-like FMN-containing flavoprotein (pyridoxamine 5'-phosphate oxidase superfamily)